MPRKSFRTADVRKPNAWQLPAFLGGGCGLLAAIVVWLFWPQGPIHTANPPQSDGGREQAVASHTNSEHAAPPKVEPALPSIDLLQRINTTRDVLDGDWLQEADKTLLAQGKGGCVVPADFTEDYRLTMQVERPVQVDTLLIGVPCAGRKLMLAIDSWFGEETGFYIDGRDPISNAVRHHGRVLATAQTQELVLTVHPRHVHLACDGNTIIDWHGDPARLNVPDFFRVPDHGMLLHTMVPYRFRRLTLTTLPPETEPRAARPAKVTDLLFGANVDRDAVHGIWRVDQTGLHAPRNTPKARIQVGEPLPREFTLKLRVQRPQEVEGERTLVVGLPTGDTQCQVVFDSAVRCGLEMIDQIRWFENEATVRGERLKGDLTHDIHITVRRSRVAVKLDGSPLLDWEGDFSRLRVPGDWGVPDARRVTFGADCDWTILDARLAPPEDLPEIPRSVPGPADLLKLVELPRDAYWGEWARNGQKLQSPSDEQAALLTIPFEVPDEYVLELDVEKQPGGLDDALLIGLPMGPRFAQLGFDGWVDRAAGITLDGSTLNETAVRSAERLLTVGRSSSITCTVRRDGVLVDCDGRRLIDWRGDPRRLSREAHWVLPLRGRPYLGCFLTSYVFTRIELRPASGFTPVSPPPRMPADGNLLGVIDVRRDSVCGAWQLSNGVLQCPANAGARLNLPDPPKGYVLKTTVTRRSGSDAFLLNLPVGEGIVSLMLDADGGQISGLELIDGQRTVANETRHDGAQLPTDQTVRLECRVTADSVLVMKDGTQFLSWKGDPRRLSESIGFAHLPLSQSERKRLAVGGWGSKWDISELTLHPGG